MRCCLVREAAVLFSLWQNFSSKYQASHCVCYAKCSIVVPGLSPLCKTNILVHGGSQRQSTLTCRRESTRARAPGCAGQEHHQTTTVRAHFQPLRDTLLHQKNTTTASLNKLPWTYYRSYSKSEKIIVIY